MMRLTFKKVSEFARKNGYVVEHARERKSDGGFVLFSNEKMPGVESQGSLGDIYSELFYRVKREQNNSVTF